MASELEPAIRKDLLHELALLVAKSGAAPLLLPPVEPGAKTFPEPWAATKSGVALLLRRLAWHAGLDREIEIEDRRAGAPLTERKPATRLELIEVRRKSAVFALGFIGEDDIAGTFAHEIGVAHAALHRPDRDDPYRTAEAPIISVDPDSDLTRGSIAAVYLGLGVLAANAARQQHSVLERQVQGNVASVGIQVEAGHLPVDQMVFLVAVQAVVRGDTAPPAGLVPAQRREVAAWLPKLDRNDLCERIGIPLDAKPGERPRVEKFADATLEPEEATAKTAFRWNTNRKGLGFIAGTVLGIGASLVVSRGMMPFFAIGGAGAGHTIGRRVQVPRCSACATVLPPNASRCPRCGATMRGDITHLSERLDAEERLGDEDAT